MIAYLNSIFSNSPQTASEKNIPAIQTNFDTERGYLRSKTSISRSGWYV